MKNKKKLVFLIPFLFIMFLGISYAAFTYVKSIGNNEFIMGDLRINYYDQSPNIKLTHLMPETKEEARDPSLHPTSSITFEGIDYIHQDNELIFSIDSISDLNNFYYSIGIKEGDSIEDKIRLNPKFLRLDLYKINVYTHEETQLLDNYQPINNPLEEMLYVDATSNETILYRIRFWVDDNIIISNSLEYRDITANDFSNGYYSIKVNVNADFDQHFMDKTYMKRYSNEEFWSPEVKAVLSTIDDVKFLHGTDELIEESFDQNVEIRYDATNYNYQTINSLNINPISVFVRTKNNRDELIVVSKSDIVLPEDCSGFLSDSGVVNLYTENFNTNLTTNMSNMFANANNLQTFGYDGEITFDTSNATNMLNMFKGTKLSIETYQNLINNMNTKNVTNMEGMFAGISTTGEINLNKLNTSNVTTMKDMFNYNSFTNIILDEFDTSKVTTMEGMFKNTSKINTINMNKLNTSNVTTMKDMFWGSNITSIDLSNLNLSNITTMYAMFYGCYELTSVQMTYQKTPEMTSNGISYMFKNCTKLVDVSLGGITTSRCNDFQYMFSGCSKIEVIDLSNFDNSQIVNMEGMFNNCTSLKTIYISDLWNNQKMLNYSGNPYEPFTGCTSLVGVIPYDSTLNTMKQANSETGYFTLK